jgi:hypothetical protein
MTDRRMVQFKSIYIGFWTIEPVKLGQGEVP